VAIPFGLEQDGLPVQPDQAFLRRLSLWEDASLNSFQSHQNAPSLASSRINTVFIHGIAEGEVVVYQILSGDHGKLKKIPFLGSIWVLKVSHKYEDTGLHF
jgi:hypothetical protein